MMMEKDGSVGGFRRLSCDCYLPNAYDCEDCPFLVLFVVVAVLVVVAVVDMDHRGSSQHQQRPVVSIVLVAVAVVAILCRCNCCSCLCHCCFGSQPRFRRLLAIAVVLVVIMPWMMWWTISRIPRQLLPLPHS